MKEIIGTQFKENQVRILFNNSTELVIKFNFFEESNNFLIQLFDRKIKLKEPVSSIFIENNKVDVIDYNNQFK